VSWAEVKKINSDLSTPLNILATIQHIDMVGENYVGYGDLKGTVDILATDALYNHMIAKTVLGDLVSSQNAVALAVAENDMALQKILVDVDIKADMGTAIKNYNDVALAVAENDSAFKKCLGDSEMWTLTSQNSVIMAHVETKLSASTGVGEWLAFLADSDNATLIACSDMTAVAASETAMTAVIASSIAMTAIIASETAMTAIAASSTAMTAIAASSTAMEAVVASETAMNAVAASITAMTAIFESETATATVIASSTAIDSIINSDVALYCISQNTTALSSLASSIENTTTILWESDLKWQTIYDTLNASALFTKSGLLTDTGGTKNRSGNLITLIDSAYSWNAYDHQMSITPAHTGCYARSYGYNWSTGKHIMWGGHTSTHQQSHATNCYVKHYMFTPIV
jgi:hypothetical protein